MLSSAECSMIIRMLFRSLQSQNQSSRRGLFGEIPRDSEALLNSLTTGLSDFSLPQIERKSAKEIQGKKDGQSKDLIFQATQQVRLERFLFSEQVVFFLIQNLTFGLENHLVSSIPQQTSERAEATR